MCRVADWLTQTIGNSIQFDVAGVACQNKMARRFTVPELDDENLRSDFGALDLLVFGLSDRPEIPQHLRPPESTEGVIAGGELQESEEVRLGYASGPTAPAEKSQIDGATVTVADHQSQQEEARVTISCDCRNTCQRKGCPCRSAGKFCKKNDCTCGSRRKPCKNVLPTAHQDEDVDNPQEVTETGNTPPSSIVDVKVSVIMKFKV